MQNINNIETLLTDRIEKEYIKGGYNLGWRFLSAPKETLLEANIAFIGLNPGGKV